ncbi:MAG TPA: two-component regulator propeller domain-containing protein, partial [Gammaproteobacteria bacterium]|nr:two-component regulator propeller domain-containing protein [Gammaproteobacteria bacterium]
MDMTTERYKLVLLSAGLLLLATISATSAWGESRFRQLTMTNGLSNARVFSVLQSDRGYVWLATEDGLDRYDGYSIKVFKNDPADPSSISSNLARVVYEDARHRLWIGTTGGGLNLYDPQTNTFQHFTHTSENPNSLASNNIWSLSSAGDGKLLVGTFDAGLDIFDPQTGDARHFPAAQNATGPSDNQINAILPDQHGIIWIGTQSGLDSFNENSGTFVHYHSKTSTLEIIRDITQDKEGRLWIASNKGLQYLDPGKSVITSASLDKTSAVTGNLSSVFIDSKDNLWIGSLDSGMYLRRNGASEYINFHQNTGDLSSLSSNSLWDIYQDHSGLIWVTTDNGVDILDPG